VEGNIDAYWRTVRRRRTSPNGVFGSKLFTRDIQEVFKRKESALGLIRTDYLINLRRRDHIQQAVSYARAMQSRVWIDGGAPAAAKPHYDFDLILSCRQLIERQEASWGDIAERTGARVLTLYYEEYSRDPEASVCDVLDFMGIHDGVQPIAGIGDTSKQRDSISAEWVRRFKSDVDRNPDSCRITPEGGER
jgi:LPS sulfotransferase NodH